MLSSLTDEKRALLESHLSSNLLQKMEALPEPGPISKKIPILASIHWSWFVPFFDFCSHNEQNLFLALFPGQVQRRLRQEIGLPPLPTPEPKRLLLRFLEQEVLRRIAHEILPRAFLPPSPFTTLLECTKRELIHIIDLLSLFDLAVERKQIVETKILRKIYSFLTESERNFLQKLSLPPTSPSFVHLRIEEWDQTKESLRHMLHRRGIARLGWAISEETKDLIWHLAHLLDVGRGTLLLKAAELSVAENVRIELLQQVREAYSWEKALYPK